MEDSAPQYELRLFVTGASPNSVRAINNIKTICEKYLEGHYTLEIIDIYQQPMLATDQKIIALPMLVKLFPIPLKRLIGDMSDESKVLKGLDYDIHYGGQYT